MMLRIELPLLWFRRKKIIATRKWGVCLPGVPCRYSLGIEQGLGQDISRSKFVGDLSNILKLPRGALAALKIC